MRLVLDSAGRIREFAGELLAAEIERVRDVLEEDQPEDKVLVLGGLDRTTQLVGGFKECGAVRAFALPANARNIDLVRSRRDLDHDRMIAHRQLQRAGVLLYKKPTLAADMPAAGDEIGQIPFIDRQTAPLIRRAASVR